ncbi:hypothetical protein [Caulobacter sp. UNC279MFTsu5.1]|uniref:hypothetical protein n=1 Tax=Caulobacter sp. UNC279MFTsu5.1 TaxID=1502775 RepID=UPI0003600130|nr:hypothetical protein [Caulobacter sp. UNC279MFTsu5.1]SFK73033.1 hypothetical protein SAMN02799626_05026 [Caulobacter sp. UNC279MFTsu5.1]
MRAPLLAPLLGLTLCLASGPVMAQAAKPPAETPTPVSPVTVMPPTQKPKVVATWPAGGQAVAPGVLVLKVVFDQQMTPRDFAYGLGTGGDTLNCLKTPRLLNDNKTFVLLCTALPGKTYAVALNPDAPGGRAFSNLAENRAEPSALTFTTGTGEPVTKLRDAIKAAGLGDLDMPVEEAPDAPQAATRTAP